MHQNTAQRLAQTKKQGGEITVRECALIRWNELYAPCHPPLSPVSASLYAVLLIDTRSSVSRGERRDTKQRYRDTQNTRQTTLFATVMDHCCNHSIYIDDAEQSSRRTLQHEYGLSSYRGVVNMLVAVRSVCNFSLPRDENDLICSVTGPRFFASSSVP